MTRRAINPVYSDGIGVISLIPKMKKPLESSRFQGPILFKKNRLPAPGEFRDADRFLAGARCVADNHFHGAEVQAENVFRRHEASAVARALNLQGLRIVARDVAVIGEDVEHVTIL